MAHIKFIQNKLGNIEIINSDGSPVNGFVKHIELFKDSPHVVHLNITEEEFAKTNNVYIHIRHPEAIDASITLHELRTVFAGKHIQFKMSEYFDPLLVVNLFLYE